MDHFYSDGKVSSCSSSISYKYSQVTLSQFQYVLVNTLANMYVQDITLQVYPVRTCLSMLSLIKLGNPRKTLHHYDLSFLYMRKGCQLAPFQNIIFKYDKRDIYNSLRAKSTKQNLSGRCLDSVY